MNLTPRCSPPLDRKHERPRVVIARRAFAIAAVLSLGACRGPAPEGVVRWAGAQHAAVHDGDVASKVRLKDLARQSHLYAIGPVEGLQGEIIVVDGKPTIVTVDGPGFRTRESLDLGAAFLVWTHAKAWTRAAIPPHVRTLDEVEAYLPQVAPDAATEPVAFRIEGLARNLRFHVLNPPPGGVRNSEDHERSKIRGEIRDRPVRMVGFYSTEHRGVFTPATSDVHVHFVTDDGTLAGHVEDFEIDAGASLLLVENAAGTARN
ncbi:MAG: acetolactate decarboxylase [Phycisphaerae bacterium]|nr:acetolactate decarboxylase [Phycisphaerae bacterium]